MIKSEYLFISNGTKPSLNVYESTDPIGSDSFSEASLWAADKMRWGLHMGVNRKFPEKIKSIGRQIKFYNQHSFRNIFAIRDNWIAYKNLCNYLLNNQYIEIIHCNTPIGGLVGRLAGYKFKKKVIYTAHGFHFYKDAPLFNRTILKWVEKWLARKTDIIITINEEDYQNASKMRLKDNGKVYKISGVGIDLSKFSKELDVSNLRDNLNLKPTDFVCISLGDLNYNKNYSTVIKAISLTKSKDIQYLICGEGSLKDELIELTNSLGLSDNIHFLGYRKDVKDLLQISDCAIISSLREGLPRTTMEAMAMGLPCVVSNIRGNRDLIEHGKGGYLVSPKDSSQYAEAILEIKDNPVIAKQMSEWNLKRIKFFDIEMVKHQILNIFKSII